MTHAQCAVNIQLQGSSSLCDGDSAILTAISTGGATLVDQSQLNYNAGTSARNLPGYSHWQSFTAGITGTLTQLDLGFFTFINGVGTLEFYQGTGTNGTLLSSQVVPVYCGGGNCLISFTVTVPVIAGQGYTFNFTPGIGIPDPYGVQVENPGSYGSGYFAIVDPSGTYPTAFDMVFKTHVTTIGGFIWSTGSTDSVIAVQNGGWYTVVYSDSSNCQASDSILIVETDPDTAVFVSGNVLTSAASGDSWQWIDCNNGNVSIPGAISQSFAAITGGSFAVIVTDNGCTDTSACFTLSFSGMESASATCHLFVYPNPSLGNYIIRFSGNETPHVCLLSSLGSYTLELIQTGFNQFQFSLMELPAGIYFLEATSGTTTQRVKIVKY